MESFSQQRQKQCPSVILLFNNIRDNSFDSILEKCLKVNGPHIVTCSFVLLALCTADPTAVHLSHHTVREVKGYVGGNISFQCSGEWSSAGSQSYFCKSSKCSSEDVLIQTDGARADATRRGRYVIERGGVDGVFTVTVMKLESADTGSYLCTSTRRSKVMHQETYHLKVLDALTVPLGPLTPTVAPRPVTELMPRDNHPSTVTSPATSVTQPPQGGQKSEQEAATHITGTMVVIIISVSLALLVCALIPVIFYGRWRSTKGIPTQAQRSETARYRERQASRGWLHGEQ
ncbi:CMRF35-like molecule 5 isoform X2 [Gadus chalcogrammus]|uniref:CMRF35-like molecule 5 isoform X2 n=1 Tax=Gadus chalcogrammus TaxID=1042646 RepID=UPI0024C315A9|nr:CMRF35-like molecule 5 isoform X2 [Gadus chalcogrammus]